MKALMKLVNLGLLLLVSGCVPSLHPLYTDKDVVFDPALVGVWAPDNDDKENWAFTKEGENAYALVYTDKDGKTGPFNAHLVKVDSAQFLDLYPAEPKLEENDFYKAHLVPAHTFLLVSQTKPNLRLAVLNADWLKRFLAANPAAIRHEEADGRIVLTAQPKDLQRFLLANLKTKDAFNEPFDLQRVKANTQQPEHRSP